MRYNLYNIRSKKVYLPNTFSMESLCENLTGFVIFIKKYSIALNQLSVFPLRELRTFHIVLIVIWEQSRSPLQYYGLRKCSVYTAYIPVLVLVHIPA